MNIQNNQFLSIEQLQDQYLNRAKSTKKTNERYEGASFQEILKQKTAPIEEASDLKFSKHAVNRLSDRNIELTDEQMNRLQEGTKKAGEKGINESLVMVDELAFIVNIKKNTVITAMDQTETNQNIFTNIDGAVII